MQGGAIILNGISRRKKQFYNTIYPVLAERFPIAVLESRSAGDAITLAAEATRAQYDFILAAGGDGTLNQVVNGILLDQTIQPPPLGLIPLGTANDFARTCHLNSDPQRLLSLLLDEKPKPTDVGMLACVNSLNAGVTRYFINCCSVGMGPAVVQRLENSSRVLGSQLTYLRSIVTTFFALVPPHVRCSFQKESDVFWDEKLLVLAIANAKTFGDAVYIAPDAEPDDGLLDIFIAGQFPTLKFILLLLKLKSAKKLNEHKVRYARGTSVYLSSPEKVAVETEGEIAGYLPAVVEVVPGRLLFFR